MKVSAVAREAREIPVDFGDGQVAHVSIDPMKYTPGLEAKFEEIAAGDFQSKALRIFTQEVIVAWDLEDDDGNVIPLTEEGINEVPVPVLAKLIQGIKIQQTPSSEEGKTLAAGSQQTETRERSLSGTH